MTKVDDMVEVHVARALRWQKHVFTHVFADFDLETYQYHALVHLEEHDGIRQVDLGALLLRNKVATSRVVVELEQKGLVVRKGDRDDTRAKRVFLTAKAKRLLPRARVAHANMSKRVVAPLGARERTELVRLLAALQDGYRAACVATHLPLPEDAR